MCLKINKKKHPDLILPRISDKPIIVSKTLFVDSTIFYKDYYTLVRLYKIHFVHGISYLCAEFSFDNTGRYIYKGIHSLVEPTNKIQKTGRWNYLFPAVIPPHTEYYVGCNGDIVSNELIIFKNIKKFENYVKQYGPCYSEI